MSDFFLSVKSKVTFRNALYENRTYESFQVGVIRWAELLTGYLLDLALALNFLIIIEVESYYSQLYILHNYSLLFCLFILSLYLLFIK